MEILGASTSGEWSGTNGSHFLTIPPSMGSRPTEARSGWLAPASDFEQKKNKMKGSAVFNVTASHILIARSFDRSLVNFLS